ncbi:MAG TPA: 50S ribosomal protein L2 [Candidatus Thermoplasmatota archaeon]|nr:50S ribosomal protein L2 [Candidatus Thermoplasmatota archaeon]
MGKRIYVQRRGKGGIHEAPGHRYAGPAVLLGVSGEATIVEILHDPGHGYPLARVQAQGQAQQFVIAHEGAFVGQKLSLGGKPDPGNVLRLADIPDGMPVFNLEQNPGGGGKFVRGPGTTATVVAHDARGVTVRLPSGAFKTFHADCRATIGVVAGGGRGEKPIAKAGKAYHKWKSTGHRFPRVRGVAMNPVDHPHGGGNAHRKEGKPTTVARGTPPGRKVGHIAARRTGIGR